MPVALAAAADATAPQVLGGGSFATKSAAALAIAGLTVSAARTSATGLRAVPARHVAHLGTARPLMIGHRGASALAPENTAASFLEAFRRGADGVECDLQATTDNVIVLHDETLQRTASVASCAAAVRGAATTALSFEADVKGVDVGSWFSADFAGERVLDFDGFLALIPAGGRAFVELKGGGESHVGVARSCRPRESGSASSRDEQDISESPLPLGSPAHTTPPPLPPDYGMVDQVVASAKACGLPAAQITWISFNM